MAVWRVAEQRLSSVFAVFCRCDQPALSHFVWPSCGRKPLLA
jgi:hypothetical protein